MYQANLNQKNNHLKTELHKNHTALWRDAFASDTKSWYKHCTKNSLLTIFESNLILSKDKTGSILEKLFSLASDVLKEKQEIFQFIETNKIKKVTYNI